MKTERPFLYKKGSTQFLEKGWHHINLQNYGTASYIRNDVLIPFVFTVRVTGLVQRLGFISAHVSFIVSAYGRALVILYQQYVSMVLVNS